MRPRLARKGRTTSATGSRVDQGRVPAHGSVPGTSGRGGHTPAFTVIELLIVVGIVAILGSILIPVLFAAKTKARKIQAKKEISDIVGALTQYYIDRNGYPPDTADWSEWHGEEEADVHDARSIHAYLGIKVKNKRGRTFGPYLNIRPDRLKDIEHREVPGVIDADVGRYSDPWGIPYQMDAVHTKVIDGEPTRVGAPYRSDSTVPAYERTLDFKVVSHGPDKKTAPYYPLDPWVRGAEPSAGWELEEDCAADDIRSW